MAEPKRKPVDTDSAVAICHALAEIENDMALLGPELSRAAYWKLKYKDELDRARKAFFPTAEGATIPAKEAAVQALLEKDPKKMLDKYAEAEACLAQHTKSFEVLDARRSTLQSVLKTHMREQEPRFGQGSHHRSE